MTFDENGARLYLECQSDDEITRTAAYERLWSYLFRVALQVVRDQPGAEALAQDCAQVALIRIHERVSECREPAAFLGWARRIAAHLAIDELRRHKRLAPLDDNPGNLVVAVEKAGQPGPEQEVLTGLELEELYQVINHAPISLRSRRVVLGRFLTETPDEQLAQVESALAGEPLLPSHIQVTRARNLAKLRAYEPLLTYLRQNTLDD